MAAGRSMLMTCVIGIYQPERGSIAIDGRGLVGTSGTPREELLSDFGVLFRQGRLFDSPPIWENVAFKLINRLHAA